MPRPRFRLHPSRCNTFRRHDSVRLPAAVRAVSYLFCASLCLLAQPSLADPRLEAPAYGNITERRLAEDYPDLNALLVSSHVIPGLHRNFVPQGIDFLDSHPDEVVLSGYFCEGFSSWWQIIRRCVRERSAFYLFDLEAGEAVRLALLEESNGEPMRRHAGGVAELYGQLWLPDSFQLFRFDLSELRNARDSVITMRPGNERRIGVDSSGDFLTAFDDTLWIGNFQRGRLGKPLPLHYKSISSGSSGWTAGYRIDPGTLRPTSRTQYNVSYGGVFHEVHRPDAALHHGSNVQGMAFLDEQRVVLSTSYGYRLSALTFHALPHPPLRATKGGQDMMLPDGSTLKVQTLAEPTRQNLIAAPPGAEGVAFNGSNLVVAFEGGALPYRKRWRRIEDRMLLLRPPSSRTDR
jgi:hypothetical protein